MRRVQMKLYEHFLKRKQEGDMLPLEELSSNDLETLFIDESKSDAMIASLFGVKSSKITYLRHKYGITICNCLIKGKEGIDTNDGMEITTDMNKESINN